MSQFLSKKLCWNFGKFFREAVNSKLELGPCRVLNNPTNCISTLNNISSDTSQNRIDSFEITKKKKKFEDHRRVLKIMETILKIQKLSFWKDAQREIPGQVKGSNIKKPGICNKLEVF